MFTRLDANFKNNVNEWIKQIRQEVNQLDDIFPIVTENSSFIQHNYELIYDLKAQLNNIEREIKALKLMQLLMIKENMHVRRPKV